MCRNNSRNNSRSNSIELDFYIYEDEEEVYQSSTRSRSRSTSRTISVDTDDTFDSIETITLVDKSKKNRTHNISNYISVQNEHKIRRRDVYVDEMYKDPSPQPALFLEKIKDNINILCWSQSKLKK